jgi:hypothetical protein
LNRCPWLFRCRKIRRVFSASVTAACSFLELVISAFKRGEAPEGVVRSCRTLQLSDVYALISRYLVNPAPFEG